MAEPTKPKPKSKEPFYGVSSRWKDVVPIPLIDGPPGQKDPGPALATIAYSVRYSEAMSYLRAIMAANEFSRRALDLTEDIISMNPAHYTVWLFRAKTLKEIWAKEGIKVEDGVLVELDWLEGISERNLKNYQIW
jgi:protein farnesyltransferase/geranylgeranyltransferase type-1 subunit alpha